jgi:hypothetical protein
MCTSLALVAPSAIPQSEIRAWIRFRGMTDGISRAAALRARPNGVLSDNRTLSRLSMAASTPALHGRQRHGIHAPFAGCVGTHRTFASVRPGDDLFIVFRRLGAAP